MYVLVFKVANEGKDKILREKLKELNLTREYSLRSMERRKQRLTKVEAEITHIENLLKE